jgi:hypothetical protein
MALLRNVDVFVKPRADLRSKSAAGGVITLVASTAAIFLFFAQLYLYVVAGNPSHTLHLSESAQLTMLPHDQIDPFQSRAYDIKGKMPLKIHITFLHMDCGLMEVKLNNVPITNKDAAGRSKHNVNNNNSPIQAKKPNPVELKRIFGSDKSPQALAHKGRGCTLSGTIRVPIVAGHVSVTLTKSAWSRAIDHFMSRSQYTEEQRAQDVHRNDFNMSHYIHSIQFGKKLPNSIAATTLGITSTTSSGSGGSSNYKAHPRPLENRLHIVDNTMGGIALENVQVKLIPTVTSSGFLFGEEKYYQMSVVEHTIQPETMVNQGLSMQPGLSIGYDVTPLAVHHDEGRDNFLIFLSSLIGIVGGCFVTVGLLTGCLVHSAKAVAKKVD